MNESNTKRLFQQFPNLYCDKNTSTTISRMADGFCCGDGWFEAIWKLSEKLERMIVDYRRNNKDDPKPPRAFQVKEKFGTLSFYMSHIATDEMREVIDEAEQKCHKTCETCGRPGKLRNNKRWQQTLCEEHNKTT